MTTPENTTVIDLRSEQADVCAGNWMQERYYSDGGARVRDLLSFASVFGVHPFEVGVDRRAERAAYRAKRGVCANLLDLDPLMRRPVLGLSNGEMRRVLFARAVLRSAGALALVSPTAGLDPRQRSRFARAIDALRDAGLDIRVVADGDDTDPREAVAGRPPARRAEKRSSKSAASRCVSGPARSSETFRGRSAKANGGCSAGRTEAERRRFWRC